MLDPLAFTATGPLPRTCLNVGGILGQVLAFVLAVLYRKDIGAAIRSLAR